LRLLFAVVASCCALGQALAQNQVPLKGEKDDFELVHRIRSKKAYEVYLQVYPNGHYAEQARAALRELQAEPRPNSSDDSFIRPRRDRLRQ
jgi:hypothetical protein